jgi:hypothetical protein
VEEKAPQRQEQQALRFCTQVASDEDCSEEEEEDEDEERKDGQGNFSPQTQEPSPSDSGSNSSGVSADATDEERPSEAAADPINMQAAINITANESNSAFSNAAPIEQMPAPEDAVAGEDGKEGEENDPINTSEYAIYNLSSSNILFPMPNNPTYQSIYAKLQDILPDTQREHAIQLFSELSIVMFSPSGDLQSNVQSTDADTIFTPNQRTDLQLLQTMAAYIKEAKKESRPYMVQRVVGAEELEVMVKMAGILMTMKNLTKKKKTRILGLNPI